MVTPPIPAPNLEPDPLPSRHEEEWPADCQIPAAQPSPAPTGPDSSPHAGPSLNWLFVDLNSYFASVEQEVRPELRGRPVAVVPMMADTTVCIAASYEAKAFGVKTGTLVADAKHLCPDIVLVEGRHEIYTDYHHRVVEAVESCLPVTSVQSIDEMACRLMGRERPLRAAFDLGLRVKKESGTTSAPCCAVPSASPPTATSPKSPATWKSPTASSPCPSTSCPKRSPAHPPRPARHRRQD
jgi:nucleotidyltransferase/DNA polymerase involved in DNA repair